MSSPPDDPSAPETDYKYLNRMLGNVRIVSVIAEGGMGVIYLGEQTLTERKVAVKVLRPERQQSERDRAYFQREARALSQIRHPNLVELYSIGTTPDGEDYMVLEYVPGRTLRQLVEDEGVLAPLRCVHLFRQLMLALEATHAYGILHRDLKPDNLLIEDLGNSKERLRLADLGLVKFTRGHVRPLTEVGMTVGTPCYMSPEQVRGKHLNAASDLYSTGVLMFETLTSFLPYPKADNVDMLLDHILDTPPAVLSRADPKFKNYPRLQRLLDRLLAKRAEERYASAAEVIEDMDQLIATELTQVALSNAPKPRPRPVSSGPRLSRGVLRQGVRWTFDGRGPVLPPDYAPQVVQDGVVVTFLTSDSRTQNKVAPSPELLQRLRSWLELGGDVQAAERRNNCVSYGLQGHDGLQRMLAGVPYLIYKIKREFPNLALRAGVATGAFAIDANGRPDANSKPARRALRFAERATDGQVLVDRKTAALHQLETPDGSPSPDDNDDA